MSIPAYYLRVIALLGNDFGSFHAWGEHEFLHSVVPRHTKVGEKN